MKILAMADTESGFIWDHYKPGMFRDIDLVISCGDLDPHYLSFVETFSNMPLLYVHGNHDEKYEAIPPEGCECIDGRIYVHEGIRILGLGGSMRYRPGKHQYTEEEMEKRIRRLRHSLKKHGGFDILVTHAPLRGHHDGEDLCHIGFEAFRPLLETYKPALFLHGHMHMNYGRKIPRVSQYGETTVINAFRTYEFEFPLKNE